VEFQRTEIQGVLLVTPDVFRDPRGFFLETYHADKYRQGGIAGPFVQQNHSSSVRGTLRGLHAQTRKPQGKLVRVLRGEIWDVAVDSRKGSPTFGKWVGALLTAQDHRQIYVPPGLLHAFCVVSESAEVEYQCTDVYDPGHEVTVLWNDPDLAIRWPIQDPILSKKDLQGVTFRSLGAGL
jgi:dTDP-4-dehydrorhamnose 3,5-epimerase